MSTLNPSAIPGLDVFEHDPRPRSLPVPEAREQFPYRSLRQPATAGQNAFDSLRQTVAPAAPEVPKPSPMEWTARQASLRPTVGTPADPAFYGDGKFGLKDPTPLPNTPPQSPTGGWLRRTAADVGQKAGGLVREQFPAPAQVEGAGKLRQMGEVAKTRGAQAAKVAGRAMGALSVADSLRENVPAMSNVFYGDTPLADKAAAALEGGANIAATTGLSLASKFPVIGPMVSAGVGPNPASRLFDTTGDSVLDKYNPGKGFGSSAAPLPTEPTASGPAPAPAGKVWPGAGGLPSYKDATRASTPGYEAPRILKGAFDRNRDNPNYDGLHSDMSGALATVPRDLPDLNAGRVYKTKDANGRTVYSGRDVQDGAKIVDGRGAITGQLNTSAAPPSAGGNSFDRELASLRELGATRAAADPGWGGGVGSMGPSLRDMARRNAETTASSIDPRTAHRGERQLDGMDKQDIANTQAGAQRYGADAGLRGTMYAADARLKGDLAQSQANTLRTQMEMNFKNGNRALMAQIYQQSGGKLDVAKKMALASGLDPQVFEQALAGDQAAEAKNQTIQGNAVDRVREDLKVYVPDKDGGPPVEDKAASQAQLDLMRRLFPGITGSDPAYYEANKAKISAMAGIFQAARQNRGIGLREFTPFGNDPKNITEMPNWKGATLSRTDRTRGITTTNLDRGEHVLKTADGKEINLGALDDTQVDLILKHAKTGSWE